MSSFRVQNAGALSIRSETCQIIKKTETLRQFNYVWNLRCKESRFSHIKQICPYLSHAPPYTIKQCWWSFINHYRFQRSEFELWSRKGVGGPHSHQPLPESNFGLSELLYKQEAILQVTFSDHTNFPRSLACTTLYYKTSSMVVSQPLSIPTVRSRAMTLHSYRLIKCSKTASSPPPQPFRINLHAVGCSTNHIAAH